MSASAPVLLKDLLVSVINAQDTRSLKMSFQ
jgi:hypothetical protein